MNESLALLGIGVLAVVIWLIASERIDRRRDRLERKIAQYEVELDEMQRKSAEIKDE